MEQLVSTSLPSHAAFGALLRAYRHRALLSQEQLAARAELSDRTVRGLEAGRVRSPRTDTVRLLADALQLTGPQRESWFAAARGVSHQRAEPAASGADSPARLPSEVPAQPPQRAYSFYTGNSRRCRRSPAVEFTAEIGERCPRGDGSAGGVAQEAGLTETSVQVRAQQPEQDAGSRSDGGLTGAERWELAELRRENRRLREDVETLKRATAILAATTR